MLQVIASLALIALGMAVDALYQRKIRIAECNAYDTGYKQGKQEEKIREEGRRENDVLFHSTGTPPATLPEGFAERLRQHGRATARIK